MDKKAQGLSEPSTQPNVLGQLHAVVPVLANS